MVLCVAPAGAVPPRRGDSATPPPPPLRPRRHCAAAPTRRRRPLQVAFRSPTSARRSFSAWRAAASSASTCACACSSAWAPRPLPRAAARSRRSPPRAAPPPAAASPPPAASAPSTRAAPRHLRLGVRQLAVAADSCSAARAALSFAASRAACAAATASRSSAARRRAPPSAAATSTRRRPPTSAVAAAPAAAPSRPVLPLLLRERPRRLLPRARPPRSAPSRRARRRRRRLLLLELAPRPLQLHLRRDESPCVGRLLGERLVQRLRLGAQLVEPARWRGAPLRLGARLAPARSPRPPPPRALPLQRADRLRRSSDSSASAATARPSARFRLPESLDLVDGRLELRPQRRVRSPPAPPRARRLRRLASRGRARSAASLAPLVQLRRRRAASSRAAAAASRSSATASRAASFPAPQRALALLRRALRAHAQRRHLLVRQPQAQSCFLWRPSACSGPRPTLRAPARRQPLAQFSSLRCHLAPSAATCAAHGDGRRVTGGACGRARAPPRWVAGCAPVAVEPGRATRVCCSKKAAARTRCCHWVSPRSREP